MVSQVAQDGFDSKTKVTLYVHLQLVGLQVCSAGDRMLGFMHATQAC